MCGLFGGYSSILTADERSVIQSLMIYNFARGEDSTGMADYVPDPKRVGHNESAFRYWKSTQNPLDFARAKWKQANEERWVKSQPRVIAGHSRAATRGKIIQNNAHPFYHKPIIGMHNGTIYGPFNNHMKFDTDSEALYANVAEMGIKDTIKDLKSAHSVAYAMVWMDCKDKSLNFLRNDKRPLHFAREGKDGTTLFWSSEALQLELALSYLKDAAKWEIMELPINKHYRFDISKSYLSDPEIEELVPPAPVFTPSVSTTGNNGHYANIKPWGEAEWAAYEADREKKGLPLVPWSEYPDYNRQYDQDYDEDDATKPLKTVLGTKEDMSEAYLMQYSTKYKEGMNKHWDLVSQRWFTTWGWHRLNSVRRKIKDAEAKNRKDAIESSNPLNDNVPDLVNSEEETPKILEEADEVRSSNFQWETAAPWHVDGDVVDYNAWLQATKKGCVWERCTFIHDADCVWVTKEYPLCREHAEQALVKGTDIHDLFKENKEILKNGLKNIKKRLTNEISLRSAALCKESTKYK